MNPKCRQSINAARQAAGGKQLTDAQAKAIDDRMNATMRRLAKNDPAWQSYPADQRVLLAAQQAAQDIADEAARKVANAQRQVLKTAEVEQAVAKSLAQGGGRNHALVEHIDQTHSYAEGIKRDAIRGLVDTVEAAKSMQGTGVGRKALMFLFEAQNPLMSRDLAMEVFGNGSGATGNKLAQDGAKAWLDTIEKLRQRFNASGGDVGKLDYGYLPQPHDQARVLQAGADKWSAEMLPKLDRSRYLNEDGSRMSDGQVLDVLRASWETISSGGLNKSTPGAFKGPGARANRGSDSRELHFKDGQAYLDYLNQYGTGSMYDAMMRHISGLTRDIALVERYGPNPEAQMRLQVDLASRVDGGPKRVFGNTPEAYWRVMSGASSNAESPIIARVASDIRNIESFGKLQGALLSSLTDLPTYFVTAGFNKLGYWEAFKNLGKVATESDTREFLTAHGVIAESMISDLNRWAGDNIKNNWSGRLSNSTMRLSLLNAWTDTLRRSFGMTMMRAMGKLSRSDWGALPEFDRWRMERHGINEADWQVMQAAQLTTHRGSDFLTPEGIYATGHVDAPAVAAKLLGMLTDESEIAVLNPDLATRAIVTGGGSQRGTVLGELARATMQFKSFPIAMMSRHWRRMLETPQGMEGAPVLANRAAYGAALMVSLTALGAVAFQTKQLVSGKDPVDMTTPKFWTRAMAQGGGWGFVGDMVLGDTTQDRSPMDSLGRSLLGPSFGSAADLWELTKGNIDESIAGKDTHIGAESLRFARGHLPLVNLWYAKAALDHMGLFALQENMSPGYLSRIQNKARKDWNQDYWWRPNESTPGRAPSFAEMAGGE